MSSLAAKRLVNASTDSIVLLPHQSPGPPPQPPVFSLNGIEPNAETVLTHNQEMYNVFFPLLVLLCFYLTTTTTKKHGQSSLLVQTSHQDGNKAQILRREGH